MIHHIAFAGMSGLACARAWHCFPEYRHRFPAAGDFAVLVTLDITSSAVHRNDFREGREGEEGEEKEKEFHGAYCTWRTWHSQRQ